jgi:hypothetical protein
VSLDSKIDDLYKLPLAEFTAARNALAKTLAGDESKRVKSLAKPTVVPWAANQLFWKARPAYDKLMKSGHALRGAQLAALSGKAAGKGGDVKRAAESHRDALAEAVRQAAALAETAGAHPDADELSRMLDSLALSATPPQHPGRLTELVRPAGFEALAGVSPGLLQFAARGSDTDGARKLSLVEPRPGKAGREPKAAAASAREKAAEERRKAADLAERTREQELAVKRRQAEADIRTAEAELERAKTAERKAREDLDAAEQARDSARQRLAAARKALDSIF